MISFELHLWSLNLWQNTKEYCWLSNCRETVK